MTHSAGRDSELTASSRTSGHDHRNTPLGVVGPPTEYMKSDTKYVASQVHPPGRGEEGRVADIRLT
jgi:hypothetical protein